MLLQDAGEGQASWPACMDSKIGLVPCRSRDGTNRPPMIAILGRSDMRSDCRREEVVKLGRLLVWPLYLELVDSRHPCAACECRPAGRQRALQHTALLNSFTASAQPGGRTGIFLAHASDSE